MTKKIFLIMFAFVLVIFSSGCGDEGKSGTVVREDPIRLVVSFAGTLDTETPEEGAVLAVRTVMPDGTLSQPFASITSFKSPNFMFYNLSVELLKKRTFLVELRDKKPMSKLFWSVEKGLSNIGQVDENSTFMSNAIIRFLNSNKTNPDRISFFIERASGEEVPGLGEHEKNGNVQELEESFGRVLEAWIAAERISTDFPWEVPHRVKGSQSGMELGRAVLIAETLEGMGREENRWLPVLYGGFQDGFLNTVSSEVTGMDWNQERARTTNTLLFEIQKRLCPVAEDNDAPAVEKKDTILESVDKYFAKAVSEDKNYDLRRKSYYIIEEIKECAGYDRSVSAKENFDKFISMYNDSIQAVPVEYGLKAYHFVHAEEYRVYEEAVIKARGVLKEKLKTNEIKTENPENNSATSTIVNTVEPAVSTEEK